jgi:hypothetical protein
MNAFLKQANKDLKDLLDKIVQTGKGRSVRYLMHG